jgi:putative methylase
VENMRIKRKDLEMFLTNVESIPEPKLHLEQYSTPARVAANMLWIAGVDHNDIFEKNVLDLGCGTGTLAIGAAFLGAHKAIGIDIDSQAIEIAKKNSLAMDVAEKCDFLCMNVEDCQLKDIDTVIMNPPFGMRKESVSRDRRFIEIALTLTETVYTIIPYAEKTRDFFAEHCKEIDAKIDQIIKMDFEIKKQFEFHKKELHITFVDLYRIVRI